MSKTSSVGVSQTVRAVLCCGLSLRSLLHQTSETSGIKKHMWGQTQRSKSHIPRCPHSLRSASSATERESPDFGFRARRERRVLPRDGWLTSAGLEHRNAQENPARSHRCPTRRIHLRSAALDVSWANSSSDNRGDCRQSATSLRSPSSQEEEKKKRKSKTPNFFLSSRAPRSE